MTKYLDPEEILAEETQEREAILEAMEAAQEARMHEYLDQQERLAGTPPAHEWEEQDAIMETFYLGPVELQEAMEADQIARINEYLDQQERLAGTPPANEWEEQDAIMDAIGLEWEEIPEAMAAFQEARINEDLYQEQLLADMNMAQDKNLDEEPRTPKIKLGKREANSTDVTPFAKRTRISELQPEISRAELQRPFRISSLFTNIASPYSSHTAQSSPMIVYGARSPLSPVDPKRLAKIESEVKKLIKARHFNPRRVEQSPYTKRSDDNAAQELELLLDAFYSASPGNSGNNPSVKVHAPDTLDGLYAQAEENVNTTRREIRAEQQDTARKSINFGDDVENISSSYQRLSEGVLLPSIGDDNFTSSVIVATQAYLDIVAKQERMLEITKALGDSSAMKQLKFAPLDVNSNIQGTLSILDQTLSDLQYLKIETPLAPVHDSGLSPDQQALIQEAVKTLNKDLAETISDYKERRSELQSLSTGHTQWLAKLQKIYSDMAPEQIFINMRQDFQAAIQEENLNYNAATQWDNKTNLELLLLVNKLVELDRLTVNEDCRAEIKEQFAKTQLRLPPTMVM